MQQQAGGLDSAAVGGADAVPYAAAGAQGRAVQVDPIKPKLQPPGTKRLKLNCDILLSASAFKLNLRRYIKAAAANGVAFEVGYFHSL